MAYLRLRDLRSVQHPSLVAYPCSDPICCSTSTSAISAAYTSSTDCSERERERESKKRERERERKKEERERERKKRERERKKEERENHHGSRDA
jgi:hypothetical protein